MANRKAAITQAAITRYFKAWKAAGFSDPRAEIKPDGTIILLPVEDKTGDSKNDWD